MVPIDQAKAQLYYTFAAHSGDKGAQMALGYRLWSGIGTLENCGKAMGWYEQASQQGRHPAFGLEVKVELIITHCSHGAISPGSTSGCNPNTDPYTII